MPGMARDGRAMDGSEVIAGRFELLGVLGRGAMGEVRKARDLETGDTVAVKRLLRRRDGDAGVADGG